MDRNTLAMEPATGGVMLAEIAPQASGEISFKMIGSPEKEPPLMFKR